MTYLDQITRPTLLLDKAKCLRNIEMMCAKAQKTQTLLRPHFKTHQSVEIGNWFRDFGIETIAVSSWEMAEYFVQAGWKDITVAFPFNPLEIKVLNSMPFDVTIQIVLTGTDLIPFLEQNLSRNIHVWLKIDAGYHRTGIAVDRISEIEAFAKKIEKGRKIVWQGFLAHNGHTYKCRTKQAVLDIHQVSLRKMMALKQYFSHKNKNLALSIGDTPSCSLVENFEGIEEVRVGNFVFYDLMQAQIGSCEQEQIAVAVACPVVAHHPERNQMVVHGGAVHFSKDLLFDEDKKMYFGKMVHLENGKWTFSSNSLVSISQEHGIISCQPEDFQRYPLGSLVGILPIHSCLTVDMFAHYLTLEGQEISKMY